MKKLLILLIIIHGLSSCQEPLPMNLKRDMVQSDTLFIGAGIKLSPPYQIVYKPVNKIMLDQGRIYHNDSLFFSFDLGLRLVNENAEVDQWILRDTITSSLQKDTLIFNWYQANNVDWLSIQSSEGSLSDSKHFIIYGSSPMGSTKHENLAFLFSEMRKAVLLDFFRLE
ncbi:hypothetical protein [Croceimicrobium hydrocarbonivorans]|uniref:Uncharacterized protein n=1 Tax=Croceimicrobium hydrocarbonivorans TaxID=2761580 RepID=A0A7H0VFQ9_9FLAO|nr:hypothetical protein [Croceimicrobium hydrocarbonivorans]QNR24557.1 hypothetical protein H4K34_01570 [Croceimicrobium hydrocarbonivorans]